MNAVAERTVRETYLEPLRDCLAPEVAERIMAQRANRAREERVDELPEKNKEGTITEIEKQEYASMIHAGSIITLLQALARNYLSRAEA